MKSLILIALMSVLCYSALAQDGTNYTYRTFRDIRVVNGHSVESQPKGEMKFIISHRFGYLSGDFYDLWGLDDSFVRYGLDYGITKNLDVGFGRTSRPKTYDFYLKKKFLHQSSGDKNMPVSASLLLSTAIDAYKWTHDSIDNPFGNRLSYVTQVLVAKKFSDRLSMQMTPTFSHSNIVSTKDVSNDLFFLGLAGRYRFSKVLALQAEYFWLLSGELEQDRTSSLSLGFEFQTKGHVFQIHLSNSRGMTENLYLTETAGKLENFDMGIGFNITRDFKIGTKDFKKK